MTFRLLTYEVTDTFCIGDRVRVRGDAPISVDRRTCGTVVHVESEFYYQIAVTWPHVDHLIWYREEWLERA